jgi:hypothetical protein
MIVRGFSRNALGVVSHHRVYRRQGPWVKSVYAMRFPELASGLSRSGRLATVRDGA